MIYLKVKPFVLRHKLSVITSILLSKFIIVVSVTVNRRRDSSNDSPLIKFSDFKINKVLVYFCGTQITVPYKNLNCKVKRYKLVDLKRGDNEYFGKNFFIKGLFIRKEVFLCYIKPLRVLLVLEKLCYMENLWSKCTFLNVIRTVLPLYVLLTLLLSVLRIKFT